jgi:hypothetical protein
LGVFRRGIGREQVYRVPQAMESHSRVAVAQLGELLFGELEQFDIRDRPCRVNALVRSREDANPTEQISGLQCPIHLFQMHVSIEQQVDVLGGIAPPKNDFARRPGQCS